MDRQPIKSVDERDALIASLQERQRSNEKLLASNAEELAIKAEKLAAADKSNEQLRQSVQSKSLKIQALEERLHTLLVQQYSRSYECFNPRANCLKKPK